MATDNLGHHVHGDKDREEEIKELFKTAEESSFTSPLEIREQQVNTPNGSQIFHSITSGFLVNDTGEWIKKDTEAVYCLLCGCVGVPRENIRVCGVSKDLVCTSHTVYCAECCQPVWVYYCEQKGDDAYCTSCLKKNRVKRAFSLFRRFLLTIIWGLSGRDYTQEHPSLSNKPLGHINEPPSSTSYNLRSHGEPEDAYQHRDTGRVIRRSSI